MFCGNFSRCRPRISIMRVHDDVASSIRKDIPGALCALCDFGKSVDCDLVVALVRPNIVDAARWPNIRSGRKLKSTYPMHQIEIHNAATKARTLLG
jgi:hypothetical protein